MICTHCPTKRVLIHPTLPYPVLLRPTLTYPALHYTTLPLH